MHPLTLVTKVNNTDTPRWHQAMNTPLKDKWWQAYKKGVYSLEKEQELWTVVEEESWMSIVPST